MRRAVWATVLGVCMTAAGGCVERKLTVTSEPEGSLAFLNDQEVGRTSVTRNFTWYGDYEVQLRGDGYETLKTHAQLTAPWWQWPPIDLVAELLPFWFTDDRSVSFVLNSASAEPADGQTMLDRAGDMREQLESSEHTRAAPGTR